MRKIKLKVKKITFNVPETVYNQIHKVAEQKGLSASDIIRMTIFEKYGKAA